MAHSREKLTDRQVVLENSRVYNPAPNCQLPPQPKTVKSSTFYFQTYMFAVKIIAFYLGWVFLIKTVPSHLSVGMTKLINPLCGHVL
jgi:hypothetical protein